MNFNTNVDAINYIISTQLKHISVFLNCTAHDPIVVIK